MRARTMAFTPLEGVGLRSLFSMAFLLILLNRMDIGKAMPSGDTYIQMKRLLKLWPQHLNKCYDTTSTTTYTLGLGYFILLVS